MAKIIFIEDEKEANHFLIDALREMAHEVEIAETRLDAEHMLKKNSYDLVVLDIMLRDESDPIPLIYRGIRILRDIRDGNFQVRDSVPVLVITALPERDVREKIKDFLSLKGKGVMLGKPFTADTFKKSVIDLIGER